MTRDTVTRRRLLRLGLAMGSGGVAGNLAQVSLGETTRPGNDRPDFVFVPGTWLGGWTWGPVRDRLWRTGYRAFTPTMSGVAERAAASHPDIDLYTHIQEIIDLITFEDLQRVILVGHSFAGLTITGVADALRDRIDHLVYFDALVPRPGTMKAWPDPDASGQYPGDYQDRYDGLVDGYQMDFFRDYTLDMLVSRDYPELRAQLRRRIRYHPWKQWSTPLVLKNGGFDGLEKTYVRCAGQAHRASSDWMPGPAKHNPDWRWIELPVSRMGMMTHPDLVTDMLIDTAKT
jgi:pimeloyl-ACP methyl ester carboxylesterase